MCFSEKVKEVNIGFKIIRDEVVKAKKNGVLTQTDSKTVLEILTQSRKNYLKILEEV